LNAIFSGIVIALGVAVLAAFVLNESQRTSYDVYKTQSVRLGDPGHNLVGPKWTGENTVPDSGV
jgi:hypothetical protein